MSEKNVLFGGFDQNLWAQKSPWRTSGQGTVELSLAGVGGKYCNLDQSYISLSFFLSLAPIMSKQTLAFLGFM